MSIIVRILRRILKWWGRKESLCREVNQRYLECIRECFVPPFSVVLCHETCDKVVSEEYGISIKKVRKCVFGK